MVLGYPYERLIWPPKGLQPQVKNHWPKVTSKVHKNFAVWTVKDLKKGRFFMPLGSLTHPIPEHCPPAQAHMHACSPPPTFCHNIVESEYPCLCFCLQPLPCKWHGEPLRESPHFFHYKIAVIHLETKWLPAGALCRVISRERGNKLTWYTPHFLVVPLPSLATLPSLSSFLA